jgi:hypothetical protein
LDWMLDDYGPNGSLDPGTFTLIQMPTAGGGTSVWGTSRRSFYGVGGTPTAWFDGVVAHVGADTNVNTMYNLYRDTYLQRRGTPTDVTIRMGVQYVAFLVYEIKAEVCIEAGGVDKDMRIYVVRVRDYYPDSGSYDRNCCRQGAVIQDVSLQPGECAVVTCEMTVDYQSWQDEENMQFIVFAQEPLTSAPAEVYQTAVMTYPFAPLCCTCAGDLSEPCNNVVNVTDFTALAAAYGSSSGDPEYTVCADIAPPGAPNGVINVTDFSVFASQYGQPCP